ncbi:MAG: translocation/assembly module TamB domain-containing protein, partial [Bacteroidota bacterium]
AKNFEFLNTTSVDNSLYYGSAYGTGTIAVSGPLNDLLIAANIKTEPGTKFFIPLSDGGSVTQEDYISFRGINDTTAVEEEEQETISGLTLDFDLEITPDAYCELIFDIKTGDIIRGRGNGNLKLSLDTDGEFNMFGPLEINDGAYNFTVPNLISKEFDVSPGSRIVWYGDPYNASLAIDATYLQRASFEELKSLEDQTADIASTRVPVLVVLSISGGLFSPSIDFDIRLQDQSDATQQIESELNEITRDEQELKRQVTSLLFMKKFSPKESFFGGGGSFGSSVSEFLSNQVSYLVSQLDENLEVEVNLADMNREAFDTFQLRFAYTFLDGKLKVSRGGGFGSGEESEEADLNDIVGDWAVEYTLTNDGKLRAKAFRNSTQRIQAGGGQLGQETGISLRFVHSFDDLKDILTDSREKAIVKKIDEKSEASSESGR